MPCIGEFQFKHEIKYFQKIKTGFQNPKMVGVVKTASDEDVYLVDLTKFKIICLLRKGDAQSKVQNFCENGAPPVFNALICIIADPRRG